MRKRILGISLVIMIVISLSGCANTIPEMDEAQQEIVVEYAASALLKYAKNSEGKLLDQEAIEQADLAAAAEAAKEAKKEELLSQPSQPEPTKPPEDTSDEVEIIDNTGGGESSLLTIEATLNLNDVKFSYIGYETDSFYPKQSDELNFVMSATEGTSLLVLRFNVQNMSGTDVELDMGSIGARYKIVINGEEKNALTTMLLEDMAYFKGTLTGDENKELVLVCEIPQQENISSLSLIVKNVDNIATISLF